MQGEDISCDVRTPLKLEDLQRDLPSVHQQLVDFLRGLENHYRDVQVLLSICYPSVYSRTYGVDVM